MDEQRNQFTEMESSPVKMLVKIGEVTTKDLEYYLVDKAVAWFEKTDFNLKEVLEGKQQMHVTENHLKKAQQRRQTSLSVLL